MGEEEEAREEDRDAVRDGSCGCDFCGKAAAAVYCRADAARLCLGCDRQVHAANSVSSQHPRALLCDACRAAPSAFLCASPHRLLLCSNCDFDAHSGCDGLHDRRPVEPFSGCPSALELASFFGVGGDEKLVVSGFPVEEEGGGDGGGGWLFADEGWVPETSPVISLEDLIVPITSFHGFQAMGTPPLPKKNRNIHCGKHKEEILRQLHELIKSETHVRNDHGEIEPIIESQSLVQQQNLQQGYLSSNFDQDATCMFVPNSEATTLQWNHSDCHEPEDTVAFTFEQLVGSSSIVNESFLDGTAGVERSACHASGDDRDARHPDDKEKTPSLLPKGGHESGCPHRDSVISRYKEKRKTRRYDKRIRYESRKARADSRMRIKGRFAKANRVSES